MDQVTHLRHLLDERGQPAPGRPGALARYYGAIVAAASAQRPGEEVLTPLRCRRRPDRHPCHGHLWVRCTGPEDREEVRWRCPVCGDGGVIRGWQGTAFDRRQDRLPPDAPQVGVLTFASAFQVREFRRLPGLSPEALRILDRARQTTRGVVVEVTADELRRLRSESRLIGAVARGRNALILAALLAQMDHQIGVGEDPPRRRPARRRGDEVGTIPGTPLAGTHRGRSAPRAVDGHGAGAAQAGSAAAGPGVRQCGRAQCLCARVPGAGWTPGASRRIRAGAGAGAGLHGLGGRRPCRAGAPGPRGAGPFRRLRGCLGDPGP